MDNQTTAIDVGEIAAARPARRGSVWWRLARELTFGGLDMLLPQTCIVTGQWLPAGQGLVSIGARRELDRLMAATCCPRCGRAARPVTVYGRTGERSRSRCGRCKSEDFWNLAEIVRIGAYEPALRLPLLGIKYRGQERNARVLAKLLADCLARRPWISGIDALVPVPMHWLRRRQRPCDHAAVLADALASELHLPVRRALRRIRNNPSQTGVSLLAEKFSNIAGCFEARPRQDLRGMTVCIVDNIVTSGATICEVSKTLRAAGAKRIYAAICARTPLPRDPRPPAAQNQGSSR